jgi:mannosyltransferase
MTTETIESPVAVAAPRSAAEVWLARASAWAWIVVPSVLAAGLALYQLEARSLWLDEAATVSIASQHGSALWHAISHDGGNMLGYYLLLHVLIGLFGDAAAVIRLPSVLATVATVALVGLIARRMLDRRGAFAAALLCAVSLPLVFWGQDARAYALMTMFIAGSFLAFMMLGEGGTRPRWAWVAYVGCTVLAAYMSFVALLVVPAQLLALLWRHSRWRVVLSGVALIAVCCVPLLVLASRRGPGQLFWVPPPNLRGLGQMARWLTSAGMPPNFHPTATTIPLLVLTLAALACVAVAAVRARSWPVLLMLSWLLVPVLLSVAESLAGQPILLYRNSLVSLPAVAVLLAWGLMRPGVPRWLGWSSLGVLLVLRALQLAPSYGVSPENWKAAARYVDARAQAGDCIAFYPADGRMAFSYYAATSPLNPVLPAAPWSATRPFVEQYTAPSAARLTAIESSCPRLWLVASHYGSVRGPAASRRNYARYVQLREALRRSYGRGVSTTFGWASPVRVQLVSR